MPSIDLSSMSVEELKALQVDVLQAISDAEKVDRAAALAAAEEAAGKWGFTLAELTGKKPKRTVRSSVEPKYRNLDDPSQTWTGRGRHPAWFKDAIAAGRSADDMLIG